MTFKVGDKVVGTSRAFEHRRGKEGIVEKVCYNGYWVKWGCDDRAQLALNDEAEPAPIGKTLTELDVKPGDVVRYDGSNGGVAVDLEIAGWQGRNCYHTGQVFGSGASMNVGAKAWHLVSRATQPTAEPEKPKRMHPDDVATACEQYLRDCGYTMARLDLVTALGAEYSIEPPRRF